MRKISLFLVMAIACVSTWAQAPNALNYQAVVRNASGQVVAAFTPVKLRFWIRDTSSTGPILFGDSINTQVNSAGVVTAAIGGTSNLGVVDWNSGIKFLEVEANINNAGYNSMGVSQLLSVPYALNAGGTSAVSGAGNYVAKFLTSSTVGSSGIYDDGSHVGVGTNSPGAPFEVHTSGAYVARFDGGSNAFFQVSEGGTAKAYMGSYAGAADDADFGTVTPNASGSTHLVIEASPKLTVAHSGMVGIGTTTPATFLNIVAPDSAATLRIQSSVAPMRPQLELVKQSGGSDWRMYVGTTTGNIHFAWGTSDFATPPTDYFEITTTYVRPSQDNYSSCGQSGNRWTAVYAANGTIQTSDARDKENVQDLNYGLREVMQLRPVSFNWKDNPQWGRKIGFVAQELQPVLKEVVQVGDLKMKEDNRTPEAKMNAQPASDKLGVYYSDIIPVLTKAIQEQQKQIEELKQKIATLENK